MMELKLEETVTETIEERVPVNKAPVEEIVTDKYKQIMHGNKTVNEVIPTNMIETINEINPANTTEIVTDKFE